MQNFFKEEDKIKLVEFLNFIAEKAVFNNLNTIDLIKYFKLLSHMQQSLLPKVEANILEVVKVTEAKNESESEKK